MKPEEILNKAASLVSGDRAKQHGDYTQQHKRVADLWSAYLKTPISAQEVAFCMVLLKISRDELGSPNIYLTKKFGLLQSICQIYLVKSLCALT